MQASVFNTVFALFVAAGALASPQYPANSGNLRGNAVLKQTMKNIIKTKTTFSDSFNPVYQTITCPSGAITVCCTADTNGDASGIGSGPGGAGANGNTGTQGAGGKFILAYSL
jgi:hypothetical protein